MNKPFFVYGTLLNGFGNYQAYLRGKTIKEMPATVPGVLGLSRGLPAMVEGNGEVHGELMFMLDNLYPTVLKEIDFLEGYSGTRGNSLYLRKTIKATVNTGEIFDAWVYIWNMSRPLEFRINHGDLRRFILEYQS